MHVAVVNDSALGSDLNRALLLALCARHVLAVRKKLQVGKPSENQRGPQQSHASDQQQTDVDSILSHGRVQVGKRSGRKLL